MNNDDIWISPEDISDYHVCPRIPFIRFFSGNRRRYRSIDERSRKLRKKFIENDCENVLERTKSEIVMQGQGLQSRVDLLSGEPDYVLGSRAGALYPLILEHSAPERGPVASCLYAYVYLLARCGYRAGRYGYIFCVKDNRLMRVTCDTARVIRAAQSAEAIRDSIMKECMPGPCGNREQCAECFCLRMCGDIF